VTVNNVAPTITSTPGNMAREAQQYTYTLTYTDPGAADTQTCSAPIKPAGSQLVGCQLVWTPDFSQAIGAAAPIRMCVTDDAGVRHGDRVAADDPDGEQRGGPAGHAAAVRVPAVQRPGPDDPGGGDAAGQPGAAGRGRDHVVAGAGEPAREHQVLLARSCEGP